MIEMILSYWPLAAIVVGAIVMIFLLKYLLKKFVIDPVIIKFLLSIIKGLEGELVELFGEKFKIIVKILEGVLVAIEDGELSESEAFDLAMSIIEKACGEANIDLTPERLLIVKFIVRKMIQLVVYKKGKLVISALDEMRSRYDYVEDMTVQLNN